MGINFPRILQSGQSGDERLGYTGISLAGALTSSRSSLELAG